MLAAILWSLAPSTATAQDGARLRVAHLSPDTPAVDVALAPLPAGAPPLTDPGPDLTRDLGYGATSDAVGLAPGSYAVSVRAAGAPSSAAPVLSARVDLPAGAARTVILGGRFADLALHTLSDDHSAPPSGTARVRVLAAAAEVPTMDVAVRGGPALASALPFDGAGDPQLVPAGPATLTVQGGGGGGAIAEVPVDLVAGSVVTLFVLDDPSGGLVVRPVLDAAGPAVVPAGAVEAGSGPGPATTALVPLAGVLVLALAGRRGRVLLATTALAATAFVALAGVVPVTATAAPSGPAVPLGTVPGRVAAPVGISVPSVGLDAALGTSGLDASRALVPPADPALAGWYDRGPRPGEPGPAVIAGHVDWAGAPGVFARLAELEAGTEIIVTLADGSTARFSVTRVVQAPKSDFPTAEVYAPTPGAELRLITCGGSFDRQRGSYADNVVVFAVAVAVA